jgi:hypothetical protein
VRAQQVRALPASSLRVEPDNRLRLYVRLDFEAVGEVGNALIMIRRLGMSRND